MNDIKKVLVAVDFSDYAFPTLRYGMVLAEEMGAEVVVVNVINQRDIEAVRTASLYVADLSPEKYIEEQKGHRLKRIDDLVDETGCGKLKISKVIRTGYPPTELLETIKESGADLVVLGTKGRSNVSNMIFGSVAEKIYRRSPVSVLSVRGKDHADLICKLDADR